MTDLEAENKRRMRQYIDAWNEQNPAAIVAFLSADSEQYGPGALREIAEAWFAAFPDLTLDIRELAADGDWVLGRAILRGTHRGAYMGVEPTGTEIGIAEQYAGGEAAIEATGHYRPIYDRLDEHLDVTLVNPGKNRLIAEASVKTDRVDAKRLAQMLRTDMLAESYVPSDEIRTLRDLVRTRKALVEERTAEKNRVRAVLKRTDNAYDSALFGPTGREYLAELSLSEADRLIVEAHLAVIEEYDT